MPPPPTVSVIVVSQDRRHFLGAAIESVAAQTIDKGLFEIIVVKNFADPRIDQIAKLYGCINLLVNSPTYGTKLVAALRIARGEVIACLDDDDLFAPRKLEDTLRAFSADARVFFFHNASVTGTDDTGLRSALQKTRRAAIDYMDLAKISDRELEKLLASGAHFNMSSIAFRRGTVDETLFDSPEVRRAWDSLSFLSALRKGGLFATTKAKLSGYRVHPSTSRPGVTLVEIAKSKLAWYEEYLASLEYFGSTQSQSHLSRTAFELLVDEAKLHTAILGRKTNAQWTAAFGLKKLVEHRRMMPRRRALLLMLVLLSSIVSSSLSIRVYSVGFLR